MGAYLDYLAHRSLNENGPIHNTIKDEVRKALSEREMVIRRLENEIAKIPDVILKRRNPDVVFVTKNQYDAYHEELCPYGINDHPPKWMPTLISKPDRVQEYLNNYKKKRGI